MGVLYHLELIDIYDELGQKCGTEEKLEVHRKALIHKGVCVWIINSNDEILLQTRNSHVKFPHLMDISFSGHIRTGETALEAAIREGKEELGIDLDIDKLRYLFTCREYLELDGYFENEIDEVFLYKADIPLEEYSFCDHEVKEVSYVPLEQFKIMAETHSSRLMPYKAHYKFLLTALDRTVIR
jgi:isopentenyldiphosphate isomerase